MRHLAPLERDLIQHFVARLGGSAGELLSSDLDAAVVADEESVPGRTRLYFDLDGYTRPHYVGQHTYGVEGMALDSDGVQLWVSMFADHNGRLLELLIDKADTTHVIAPNLATLTLF